MFKCLGLDVDGTFDYQPDDLIGCYINAEVLIEDYVYNGVAKQKNTIDLWNSEPYSAKAKAKKEEVEEISELPF
jgi:hypothetical protein